MQAEKRGLRNWPIWRFRKEDKKAPHRDLEDLLGQALQEWRESQAIFNEMTEPDLVDLAIHQMALTESRYTYLLKEARRQGYSVWPQA